MQDQNERKAAPTPKVVSGLLGQNIFLVWRKQLTAKQRYAGRANGRRKGEAATEEQWYKWLHEEKKNDATKGVEE